MKSNVFYRASLNKDSSKYNKKLEGPRTRCHPYDANIVSSEKRNSNLHDLFLDLDVDHFYTKSSTQYHGHLAIKADLKLEDVIEILEVLCKHKIIQEGFLQATKDRGWAALRMPDLDKRDPANNRWFYEAKKAHELWEPMTDEKLSELY